MIGVSRLPRLSAIASFTAAAWLAASSVPAAAQSVANFYSGKTVNVLIGFTAGGGYDLYGRTLARYLGRYIPGNPNVVAQNMPGAGSLKVVNYLYNAAPKDGTAIAHFAPGIMFERLLGRPSAASAQFEATKFNWLGSVSREISVCGFTAASGIKTWHDMQTRQSVIAASGGGAESDVFPTVLRNMFGLPIKLVTGYPGGAEMVLAMQRHEVDGRCGWSWTSVLSRNKELLDTKQINLTLQIALQAEKHPALQGVPVIVDVTDDPAKKAALKLIVSRQAIARPFAAPPDLPAERAQALRAAFAATMKDPDFLAEMKKVSLDVDPVTGAEVEALIREVYASSPEAVRLAAESMKPPKE
jgi:tripartite-type tricarboxylate transporter receptor subunit TctC